MGDPVDAFRLKQLRLRLDTEDPSFPGWKRLKLGGKDLSKLPREVFQLAELEILNLSPGKMDINIYNLSIAQYILPPNQELQTGHCFFFHPLCPLIIDN